VPTRAATRQSMMGHHRALTVLHLVNCCHTQVKPLLPEETVRKIAFVTSNSATMDSIFAEEFDDALNKVVRRAIANDKK